MEKYKLRASIFMTLRDSNGVLKRWQGLCCSLYNGLFPCFVLLVVFRIFSFFFSLAHDNHSKGSCHTETRRKKKSAEWSWPNQIPIMFTCRATKQLLHSLAVFLFFLILKMTIVREANLSSQSSLDGDEAARWKSFSNRKCHFVNAVSYYLLYSFFIATQCFHPSFGAERALLIIPPKPYNEDLLHV